MIVTVEPAEKAVGLTEVDDFTAFHVQIPPGAEMSTVDTVLRETGVGSVEDGYVWVRGPALEALAAAAGAGDGWRDGYQAMVGYARRKGWCRPDGTIRAHVQRA
ncbi:hypothetical protein [Amycolatopsis sp.]|uniref:hypothetical protein n=1 Tax=Amycolatopsis sp. TaxID=37632 RepID=UPI002C61B3E7|nr:hypothetical protein [Amycolatopsis sp.]HVV08258.1 hypothetical protein [Amycolatopsis sp.]